MDEPVPLRGVRGNRFSTMKSVNQTGEHGTQESTASQKCDICHKSFVRAEHLERHRRIHTKEKPFACPFCPRAFQRSDVRMSHVKKSHGRVEGIQDFVPSSEAPRKRVRVACDLCRKRKMRCDGRKPCHHCRGANSACLYHSTGSYSSDTPGQALEDDSSEQTTSNRSINEPRIQSNGSQTTPEASACPSGGNTIELTLPQAAESCSLQSGAEPGWSKPGNGLQTTGTESDSFMCFDSSFPPDDDLGNVTMTETFWQLPALDGEHWWSGLNLDDGDTIQLLTDQTTVSSPLQRYSLCMQEYFDRKPRASSPGPLPNKTATMWYSAPASLTDHDLEIMNVFLTIFSRSVPKTFRLFRDLEITSQTKPEFILAAAAVGGLYCTVEGSFNFTKAMHNDSRRLLLAYTKSSSFYNRSNLSSEEMLVVIKTFILHEIYGLCSGDRRSYEFVEVFHQDLVKAVQTLSELLATPNTVTLKDEDVIYLLESLYILDCYRVVLLQRPSSLPWQPLERLAKSPHEKSRFTHLRNVVRGLASPGHEVDFKDIQELSLATLSGLTPFLWQTMPLAPADQDSIVTTWRPDFVELAADKWLRLHLNKVQPSSQTLYHLMHITMHANLLAVNNYALWHATCPNQDQKQGPSYNLISRWVSGRHYEIAAWHAERVLECVENSLDADAKGAVQGWHGQSQQLAVPTDHSKVDVVHVPYSVYYATLVLWCGATVADEINPTTGQSCAAVRRGRDTLKQLKLRIATVLEGVLRGLRR